MDLEQFIKSFVLPHENVYDKHGNVISENRSNDPGGLTKYGIDQRAHPDVDIENLDEPTAIQEHIIDYHHSRSASFPDPAGFVYFDCAMNAGNKTATLCYQRSVGITDDGVFGSQSVAHIMDLDPGTLSSKMIGYREVYYRVLSRQPRFEEDLAGWINRCNDLRAFFSLS